MSIRWLRFTVGDDMEISPSSIQKAGTQGDHEATCVQFIVPEKLRSARQYDFSIEQVSSTGAYDMTGPLELDGGTSVLFYLPRAWTQDGGKATLRLVAYRKFAPEGETPETVYSGPARIVYADRQTAFQRTQSLIAGTVQHLIEVCRRAIERVDRAGVAAENFVEQLPDMAAGKNCYRIIEQNEHAPTGIWIGSSEEYEKLEKKPNNTLVVFTDNPKLKEMLQAMSDLNTKIATLEKLMNCTTYAQAIDFNNFTTDCLMYVNYYDHLNSPTGGATNGLLKVWKQNGEANQNCVQLFFQMGADASSNAGVYFRRQCKGVFAPWLKIEMTAVTAAVATE